MRSDRSDRHTRISTVSGHFLGAGNSLIIGDNPNRVRLQITSTYYYGNICHLYLDSVVSGQIIGATSDAGVKSVDIDVETYGDLPGRRFELKQIVGGNSAVIGVIETVIAPSHVSGG